MSYGRFDNPIIAALTGFFDLFRAQPLAKRLTDQDLFDGKTVLITGANSGLGFALAVEAARRGGSVLMCMRRQLQESADAAKQQSSRENIEARYLDLTSIESIHNLVRQLAADDITLDVTYLNAATTLPDARRDQLRSGRNVFCELPGEFHAGEPAAGPAVHCPGTSATTNTVYLIGFTPGRVSHRL